MKLYQECHEKTISQIAVPFKMTIVNKLLVKIDGTAKCLHFFQVLFLQIDSNCVILQIPLSSAKCLTMTPFLNFCNKFCKWSSLLTSHFFYKQFRTRLVQGSTIGIKIASLQISQRQIVKQSACWNKI